jgi:DNA replication ATP-dependent helicase Dna2
MILASDDGEHIGGSKAHRFSYTFTHWRSDGDSQPKTQDADSLMNSTISVGDPIVISSEQGHYALAIGFVASLTPSYVKVNVDRALHGIPERLDGFHATSNQTFKALSKYFSDDTNSTKTFYRIDKDEMGSSMSSLRGNLINLFKVDGDMKRRGLIVDLEAPVFRPLRPTELDNIDPSLNVDQRKAVERVMSGMPPYTTALKFVY